MNQFVSAVIGCGRMGAFTTIRMEQTVPSFWLPLSHSAAIAAHPELRLSALCDVDPELLALAQKKFGVEKGYADYRQLIDQISPQALGVATRTPQRPAIIEYAVERGVKALHLEKPLCNSVAQLHVLEKLLAPAGIICTYGTLRRYLSVYRHARDLAHSGRYGALQQVHVSFGTATLLWTHPHSLDMLLFMAGDADVQRVSARFADGIEIRGTEFDGDPTVLFAAVEFSNGITGVIGREGGLDVVLSCSEGVITVESDGNRIRCRHGDGISPYWECYEVDEYSQRAQEHSAGGGVLCAFDRLVTGLKGLNEKQVAADKKAIFEGQRLLFACAQSHLRGGVGIAPWQLDPRVSISGRSGDRYA